MVLIGKSALNLSFKCKDHCKKDNYNKKSLGDNDDDHDKHIKKLKTKHKDRFQEFKEDFYEKCEDIQEMFSHKSHKD